MDIDDRRATELLMPLRQAPRGPSAVDVGRAVARGERRRTTIRAASVAAVVLVVLVGGWAFAGTRRAHPDPVPAISASPTVQPTAAGCTPARLEAPPEATLGSTVTGGDPSGRYQVGQSFDGTGVTLLIWDRGRYEVIGLDGRDQTLVDVNSNGMAVGWTQRQRHVAVVFGAGEVRELAGAAGLDARALAINDRGQIAGQVQSRPVLWQTAQSQPTRLALPGPGYSGEATGVDEDGTVAGTLFHDDASEVWVWPPGGAPARLAAPVIGGRAVTTYAAVDIRNGWVLGRAGDDAALWNLRTGELRVITWGFPLAVNARGWTTQANGAYAAIDTGAARIDLPASSEGWTGEPVVLSDDGHTVAGTAITSANGHRVAMLWTCR